MAYLLAMRCNDVRRNPGVETHGIVEYWRIVELTREAWLQLYTLWYYTGIWHKTRRLVHFLIPTVRWMRWGFATLKQYLPETNYINCIMMITLSSSANMNCYLCKTKVKLGIQLPIIDTFHMFLYHYIIAISHRRCLCSVATIWNQMKTFDLIRRHPGRHWRSGGRVTCMSRACK